MNLHERFDVRSEKVEGLKARIARLGIDLRLVEERFVRGGGRGGQKINKTSNCVQLSYAPMEIVVRMHRDRRRSINRFLALRELVDRIEARISPATSERPREIERIRRQQTRRRRRRNDDMSGVKS